MDNSTDTGPILIIGANARFLAENAVRHGHDVFVADYYGDVDTRASFKSRSVKRDGNGEFTLRSLVDLARGIKNSGIVYGPGFENDIFALTKLKELGPVIGCGIEAVRKSRDPETLLRSARSWNFKYPSIRYEKVPSMKGKKWLTKPFAEMGGVNVRFTDATTAPGVFYQEYVEGLPSSAIVVSNGSECTVLGLTTQIIGDPALGADNFRYAGNVFPHPFTNEAIGQATAIADSLTLELDLKGLWGFDFIYNGEVVLIEINPRPTAGTGVLSMGTWNDLLGLHIDSVSGKNSNIIIDPGPTGSYFAQSRVFAREDSTFTGAEKWKTQGGRDIPEEGEFIPAGAPVLTVSAEDITYNGVIAKLHDQAKNVYNSLTPATATML